MHECILAKFITVAPFQFQVTLLTFHGPVFKGQAQAALWQPLKSCQL